ncbi:hypothetical protein EYF80_037017 [Liparis tanakae]|uniref:Uncharacterized protein n=1 Tax=Liparis tanakae TaxID=230148 RepID=A0A4Z2GJ21_9TELE|nr:hypothetical protein EYF80_037017 [Liparis tanakae]
MKEERFKRAVSKNRIRARCGNQLSPRARPPEENTPPHHHPPPTPEDMLSLWGPAFLSMVRGLPEGLSGSSEELVHYFDPCGLGGRVLSGLPTLHDRKTPLMCLSSSPSVGDGYVDKQGGVGTVCWDAVDLHVYVGLHHVALGCRAAWLGQILPTDDLDVKKLSRHPWQRVPRISAEVGHLLPHDGWPHNIPTVAILPEPAEVEIHHQAWGCPAGRWTYGLFSYPLAHFLPHPPNLKPSRLGWPPATRCSCSHHVLSHLQKGVCVMAAHYHPKAPHFQHPRRLHKLTSESCHGFGQT